MLRPIGLALRARAPLKQASRLLLDVAATPPMSGGEWRAAQFIHTFYDRAHFNETRGHRPRLQRPIRKFVLNQILNEGGNGS